MTEEERATWFARFRHCSNSCGVDAIAVCEVMRTGTTRPALQCPRCLKVTAYIPQHLMSRDVESLPIKLKDPDFGQQSLFNRSTQ